MTAKEKCTLCPRNCSVDRNQNAGYCGELSTVRVTRAAPHCWEEPCISGSLGSGTVFFSGCNLRCVFCQNKSISMSKYGKEADVDSLAQLFIDLSKTGVHNINLVTPSHFTTQIAKAIEKAKLLGLSLPFVWNSSGYEKTYVLKSLDGLIDVYLPDFKYKSPYLAKRYSNAEDYFDVTTEAVDEMLKQVGEAVFRDGLMKKGIIVRHLVLPGCTEDSKAVLRHLAKRYGDRIYISIMNQYTPIDQGLPDSLSRKTTEEEYLSVLDYASMLGISKGFIQEGGTANESFIPAFDYTGLENLT